MAEYRFSPIDDPNTFDAALDYVSETAGKLVEHVCRVRLPVSILKLYAHSPEEYAWLEEYVNSFGPRSPISSENSHYVTVENALRVGGVTISLLGVRVPKEDRPEVGAGDCVAPNFTQLATHVRADLPAYASLVYKGSPAELAMVELQHPKFDVLAYLIPQDN